MIRVAVAGAALTHYYLDEEDPVVQMKKGIPSSKDDENPTKGLLI